MTKYIVMMIMGILAFVSQIWAGDGMILKEAPPSKVKSNKFEYFTSSAEGKVYKLSLSEDVPPEGIIRDSGIKLSRSFDTIKSYFDSDKAEQIVASFMVYNANFDMNVKDVTHEIMFSHRDSVAPTTPKQVLFAGGDGNNSLAHSLELSKAALAWIYFCADAEQKSVQLELDKLLDLDKRYYACSRLETASVEKKRLHLFLAHSDLKVIGKATKEINRAPFLVPGERMESAGDSLKLTAVMLGRSSNWSHLEKECLWNTFGGHIGHYRATPRFSPDDELMRNFNP